jgi:hypothetical protein
MITPLGGRPKMAQTLSIVVQPADAVVGNARPTLEHLTPQEAEKLLNATNRVGEYGPQGTF